MMFFLFYFVAYNKNVSLSYLNASSFHLLPQQRWLLFLKANQHWAQQRLITTENCPRFRSIKRLADVESHRCRHNHGRGYLAPSRGRNVKHKRCSGIDVFTFCSAETGRQVWTPEPFSSLSVERCLKISVDGSGGSDAHMRPMVRFNSMWEFLGSETRSDI